jgi:hypothetical protein
LIRLGHQAKLGHTRLLLDQYVTRPADLPQHIGHGGGGSVQFVQVRAVNADGHLGRGSRNDFLDPLREKRLDAEVIAGILDQDRPQLVACLLGLLALQGLHRHREFAVV